MEEYQAIYRVSAEVSRLLSKETPLKEILTLIGKLAVETMPSCEKAGVTLEDHARMLDRVVTDAELERVDSFQYSINQGPGVYASREGVQVLIPDMAVEMRWPDFAKFAAKHGVVSTFSIPMKTGDEVVGVLNLYSYHNPFGPDDERVGLLFAQEAAVAAGNAATFTKTRELVDNLNRALETRQLIGTAIGMIMLRERITSEEAFDLLKEASQNANIKLRDVAQEIIEGFQKRLDPAGEHRQPDEWSEQPGSVGNIEQGKLEQIARAGARTADAPDLDE